MFFGLLIIGVDGYAHGESGYAAGDQSLTGRVRWSLGVLLVRRQLDRSAPLLPVDLLRIPLFRLSVATSVCSLRRRQMLAFVSLPFYLQGSDGVDGDADRAC